MKKILCIDGGGIRGIVPAILLRTLEEKLQRLTKNPHARLSNFFDFMAGTSTGGILTCLYLTPSDSPDKFSKYSAAEAANLYIEHGGTIFDIPVWKKLESVGGLTDEKFDATALEKLLKKYFGMQKLSKLVKPCLITSYDLKRRRLHLFTQADAQHGGDGYDFYLKDVCRATSAAPTYFEPNLVYSLSRTPYPLVDGGVVVNNPAMCAYSEVRNALPANGKEKVTASDMFILSFGTGSLEKPYEYEKAKNWGIVSWVSPVIDIMMSGSNEVTHHYLSKIFDAVNCSDQYVRITPSGMYNADYNMANASEQNIRALVELGTICAQENDAALERVAKLLYEEQEDAVVFSNTNVAV